MTGKPGLLQSTGLQKVEHDLVTEQQQENECFQSAEAKILKACYCQKHQTIDY